MNNKWNKLVKTYDFIVNNLVFLLFMVMVFSTFIGTVFRYLPFLPGLFWTSEISRFMMIWSILLISGHGIRQGTHLGLDYLITKLPDKYFKIVYIIGNTLVLAFLLLLLIYGLKLTKINMEQLSSALRIPMGYVFAAIPVGAFLMMVELIYKVYMVIRGKYRKWDISDSCEVDYEMKQEN